MKKQNCKIVSYYKEKENFKCKKYKIIQCLLQSKININDITLFTNYFQYFVIYCLFSVIFTLLQLQDFHEFQEFQLIQALYAYEQHVILHYSLIPWPV